MKRIIKYAVYAIVILLVVLAFFEVGKPDDSFGWISLLPPIVAILLAFTTRQVILSLFLGVFVGVLLLNDFNFFIAFIRTLDSYIVGSLADGWNAAIIIFTLTIGGMIGIIGKMGGTAAIAEALAKKAKTSKSAMLVTAIMGVLVFFDDYANTLIVGPTMRPLTDKLKISREKLSYIVDSTAAPVVGLAFISTWVGYEIGLISNAFTAIGAEANFFTLFIKTIPYTFYNIFALALVFMVAGMQRDYGPMYHAEKRARLTGEVLGKDAKPMTSKEITDIDTTGMKLRAYNAIIPILVLIIVAFAGLWYNGYLYAIEDGLDISWYTFEGIRESFGYADASVVLIWAAITASIVAGFMAVVQKLLSLEETFDAFVEGNKALLITAMILILAWSLGGVTGDVGTADWLILAIGDFLPAMLLPIIVFAISMLIAFATGTSWGTMAIVIPLAVPIAAEFAKVAPAESALVIGTLSAVLSGSIFGDHCSPISDTTIMSSMASGSDHIDHVKTQIPYSLTGAGFAIVGYLIVGLLDTSWSPLVSIAVGLVGLYFFLKVFGKSTKVEDLQ